MLVRRSMNYRCCLVIARSFSQEKPPDTPEETVADFLDDIFSLVPPKIPVEHKVEDSDSGELVPSSLTTSNVKTRKGRSDHYFPKRERVSHATTLDGLKMEAVMRSYMTRGHLTALIDPLYIVRQPMFRPEFPSRNVLKQRRVPIDRDIRYLLPNETTIGNGYYRIALGDLIQQLNAAYCSTIGFEFAHINAEDARGWIRERIETTNLRFIHKDQKIYCAKKLIEIDDFSAFLNNNIDIKQNKRYNVDGSESCPLGLDLVIQRAAKKYGAEIFVLGMRRLSRFNVLSTLGINHADLFKLMTSPVGEMREKYCLGTIFETPSLYDVKKRLKFIMVANPAIPQSFYPVVLGKTKGLQDSLNDKNGEKVWPIIIHMAKGLYAQGITYETLKLGMLPKYNTHGTIHLVFNNQMEHTLKREISMKTEYCTDVMKSVNAPIFHVNGDDLAAVHFACRMAADYRAKFKRDVVIDIVSYQRAMARRTQTKYELVRVQEKINQIKPLVPTFLGELEKANLITKQEIDLWKAKLNHQLSQDWHSVHHTRTELDKETWSAQNDLKKIRDLEKSLPFDFETGVKRETLKQICNALIKIPDQFQLSSEQLKVIQERYKAIENNKLDWILCEALAYGSLLLESKNIRISGMDANRRFHILHEDKLQLKEHNFLQQIAPEQGKYHLCKSTSSQYAAAGFEYGYSTTSLDTLVVWEAPEGDKTSKAQVIIDNYIAGGHVKYNYQSNIVFLLPHFINCENPTKVSNGRPERFLQLVNDYETHPETNVKKQMKDTNMILANVSTPANFFHILRRQFYLPFRRPLVIFTPDILASHEISKATFEDLSLGTKFQPYFTDDSPDSMDATKILFCTGKIYYDLVKERSKRNLENKVAICRIEQLSPLPYEIIIQDMKKYYNAKYIAWVQEEPINQGWFNYVELRLLNLPNFTKIECIARTARADGGFRSVAGCKREMANIYERAFSFHKS